MPARYDLLKRYGGVAQLRDAAIRSPAVYDEIQYELAQVKGISASRCQVTKEYADALRLVLEGQAWPQTAAPTEAASLAQATAQATSLAVSLATSLATAQASASSPSTSSVAPLRPTEIAVGDYTILQDRHGGLQIKASDGTMIPLVQKDE